jgi:DNA-binding NarL/FixJ family response regulator
MSTPIKLILADDHQMLREGFKIMMKKESEINLVAEAANGEQLLQEIEKHRPDVVITDIKMPGVSGIQVCRIISEKYPSIGVIALSTYDTDDFIVEMLDAGARGYLLKNTDRFEVIRAVKAVYEGGTYFCDHVTANFHKMLLQTRHPHYNTKTAVEFSDRELEIIKLSIKELTNKEIASLLSLSTRTVEAHKNRMQAKVEAKNMVGVIIYALRHNLISLETT